MRGGKCLILFVFFILFLLLLPNVSAIGISPADAKITYDPNTSTYTLTFYAVNLESHPVSAKVYANGELSSYVSFDKTEINLDPKESEPFKVFLTLPANLSEGKYVIDIGLTEANSKATGMAAFTSVESILEINNPYAKGHLNLQLKANNVSASGGTVNFDLILENPTDVNVSVISSDIRIYDSKDNEIKQIPLKITKVPANNKTTLNAKLQTLGFYSGIYKAIATVSYEDNSVQNQTFFQIGKAAIDIISVNITSSGDTTKFLIKVQNKWNTAIKNVYATIKILDEDAIVGETQSSPIELAPLETETLVAYWDGVYNPTKHDVNIVVHYGSSTKVKDLGAKQSNIVGKTISWNGSQIRNIPLSIIVIVILLFISILLMILYFKPPRSAMYVPRYYRRFGV